MALHAIYFIWISLESLTPIAYTIFSINFCTEAPARSRYNNNDEPCLASMQFCVVITHHTFCHFIQLNWSLRNISCIVDNSYGRIWVKAKQFYKHGGEKTPFKKILAIRAIWRYFAQSYRSLIACLLASVYRSIAWRTW